MGSTTATLQRNKKRGICRVLVFKAEDMQGTVHLFDHLPQVEQPVAPATGGASPPIRAVPLVGVIRNPRSHRNAASEPEWSGRATMMVETPHKRSELDAILRRFAEAQVDFLVVDGGDGTVRDVLTCGAGAFGETWPQLIVLPSGKTNALAIDLGLDMDWTLDRAIECAREGRHTLRRPMVISLRDNPDARVQGFVFGAGVFTPAISLGQHAHKRGAFNAAAVGVTTVWTLFQALVGSPGNIWRRGTRMRLRDAEGTPLPHSGHGRPEERYFIFGSTLEKLPAGLTPFRGIEEKLRFVLMDNSKLSLLLRLPLVYFGKITAGARRYGFHRFGCESLEMELGGNFILDGEAFPPGAYRITLGPQLRFVVP